MQSEFDRSALMEFLRNSNEHYAKISEMLRELPKLLSYIQTTFPHYTTHTIEHSKQIVVRISQFLFDPDGKTCAASGLNHLEAFILVASAFLHDLGMVVSETEKQELLVSVDWQNWLQGDESRQEKWGKLRDAIKAAAASANDSKILAADYEARLFLSDYFRQNHHRRSRKLTMSLQPQLGRFAFDDPILTRTISDVCEAHGLSHSELDSAERYPLNRTIGGYSVNVRFLAIVLRLGDLLDLSHERACPMLVSAAAPIPRESLSHWTQYQRISDLSIDPTEIRLRAECENADEHRVLRDWCQWIVDELRNVNMALTGGKRHSSWIPPKASLVGENPTIIIKPSDQASYKPVDWRFEFDEKQIFERLVVDTYRGRIDFLRELLQNAADATRCKMYQDAARANRTMDANPAYTDIAIRQNYPISLDIITERPNPTGSERLKQVRIRDIGIGMSSEIIEKYFLQIGKSFYGSQDFKNQYKFHPVSKFGIGFLSVFSASSDVEVKTLHAKENASPVRLRLSGPRNYIIVERADISIPGTEITIKVDDQLNFDAEKIEATIRDWCVSVEFPILLKINSRSIEIRSELETAATFEIPKLEEPGSKFLLEHSDFVRSDVKARFYWISLVTKDGISDPSQTSYYCDTYQKDYPSAEYSEPPRSWMASDGFSIRNSSPYRGLSSYSMERGLIPQFDFRSDTVRPNLSRSEVDFGDRDLHAEFRSSAIQEILRKTAAQSGIDNQRRWRILNSFILSVSNYSDIPEFCNADWFQKLDGVVRWFSNGIEPRYSQLGEIREREIFSEIVGERYGYKFHENGTLSLPKLAPTLNLFTENDCIVSAYKWSNFSVIHSILRLDREIQSVRKISDEFVRIDWMKAATDIASTCPNFEKVQTRRRGRVKEVSIGPFEKMDQMIGLSEYENGFDRGVLLNSNNALVVWLDINLFGRDSDNGRIDVRLWREPVWDTLKDAVSLASEERRLKLENLLKRLNGMYPDLHMPLPESIDVGCFKIEVRH